jgi:hypothetical protein
MKKKTVPPPEWRDAAAAGDADPGFCGHRRI